MGQIFLKKKMTKSAHFVCLFIENSWQKPEYLQNDTLELCMPLVQYKDNVTPIRDPLLCCDIVDAFMGLQAPR